jgi:uncharacterized protein
MQLWGGSLKEFIREAESGSLPADMLADLYRHRGVQVPDAELNSWAQSLPALSRVCKRIAATDLSVVLEYHLPFSGLRIDAVLLGRSQDGHLTALIVELKQWSVVETAGDESLNVVVAGQEHAHPSQQALNYAEYLTDVHSSFVDGRLAAASCAYLHNLAPQTGEAINDAKFASLLAISPSFTDGDEEIFADHILKLVGAGGGAHALTLLGGGHFKPSRKLVEAVEETLDGDLRWRLVGEQQDAYNAIMAAVKTAKSRKRKYIILVRGGPGTGKTVIAMQVLADALRLGYAAVHSTGGAAFTTVLRSKFGRASKLFIGNMDTRNAPTDGLDVLLVDEGHRIRETSDIRFTPVHERGRRSQMQELVNAAKVTVIFLDDNQFVRPDEIGSSALVVKWAAEHSIPLKRFDLVTQFRCGGCCEYLDWVDGMLGFVPAVSRSWQENYTFRLVDSPEELEQVVSRATRAGMSARIVAGFCWRWNDRKSDESLPEDVSIGEWKRPWNAKRDRNARYTPLNDPYTRWAETEDGETQVGCIYSAQGFEFDVVGVIWGTDLVWRTDRWVAQPKNSYDQPIRRRDSNAQVLLRNAYRVLMTRGTRETTLLCLDSETSDHIRGLAQVKVPL